MSVSAEKLYDVIEATWPPASMRRVGPWMIREGQGGGQRVSATTAEDTVGEADLAIAEDAMRDLGQPCLFMIRKGDDALDVMLADRGYLRHDEVTMFAGPAEVIGAETPPRTAAIPAWEPLRIMEEIWARGGIGPGRIAVMRRAVEPKTGLVSRWREKPAAAAFCAIHDGIAMVHALEVVPFQRRSGVGRWMMMRAAIWARAQGAPTLAVVCTSANKAACGLYSSLGMEVVGQYHYRLKPDEKA